MKFVKREDLKEGMRLGKPIYNKKGVLLYERDSKLTRASIESARNFGLMGVYVLEPTEPLPPMSEEDIEFEKFQIVSEFALMDELVAVRKTGKVSKLRLRALVAGVAVVSFVAGGVTARMGSQMPVLFAERQQPLESIASLVEQAAPEQQEPLQVESPEAPVAEETEAPTDVNPPSYDTGDDTTDDAPWTTQEDSPWHTREDTSWDTDDTQTDGDQTDENRHNETLWYEYTGDEGDRGFSLDTQDNSVTFDYDGHSIGFTFEDLISNKDDLYKNDQHYQYDGGTGDDVTNPERDVWGWRTQNDMNYGYHT